MILYIAQGYLLQDTIYALTRGCALIVHSLPQLTVHFTETLDILVILFDVVSDFDNA